MGTYQFRREQKINASQDRVWDFIATPANLKLITPDYMSFDILGQDLPEKMYAGMILMYRVSPLLGIKLNWVTEISHVKEGVYFVDEQRIGPYRLWHHQHHLKSHGDGVVMEDVVTYSPPFGLMGSAMKKFIIERKLNEIFDYRESAIDAYFGEMNQEDGKHAEVRMNPSSN